MKGQQKLKMESAGGGGGGEGGSSALKSSYDFLESGGNHHRHRHYSGVAIRITLLLVTMGIIYLVLNQSAYPTQFFRNSYSFSPATNKENDLENTLKKAAMKDNKTVIITTLNAAWTEPNSIFDLFLESFKIGNRTENLLNHVVVVALDRKAYSRCLQVHRHCHALTTAGIDFSGEAHFMSEDYLKMMWRRIDFLRIVLERGYNFVFTDADIMWLRNPFPHFYSDTDFQISCDSFRGNPIDLNNAPNGGFNYVKSSNQTIEFYKFWYKSREFYPRKHDQDVLNKIKHDDLSPSIVFIDEIDAVGTKRYDAHSGGEREIQRTMLELLNQLDGFDSRGDVKVILATNKIESLDPALLRPGRIDRKIEFPLPDIKTRRRIFQIHTSRMTLADDVNLEEFVMTKDEFSGADIKAICTEAGLLALRERRMKVTHADFKKAKDKVMFKKKEGVPEGLYM